MQWLLYLTVNKGLQYTVTVCSATLVPLTSKQKGHSFCLILPIGRLKAFILLSCLIRGRMDPLFVDMS